MHNNNTHITARTAFITIINSHRHLVQFKDELLFDYWHKVCYIAGNDKLFLLNMPHSTTSQRFFVILGNASFT